MYEFYTIFILFLGLCEPSDKDKYTQDKPSTSDNDLWKKEEAPNESDENESMIEYAKDVCTVKPLEKPVLLCDPSPPKTIKFNIPPVDDSDNESSISSPSLPLDEVCMMRLPSVATRFGTKHD